MKFILDIWRSDKIYCPSFTTDFEKETLWEHCIKAPVGDALEIGSYYGANLFIIAKTWQLLNRPGLVVGIDLWLDDIFKDDPSIKWKEEGFKNPTEKVMDCAQKYGVADRIVLRQEDSVNSKFKLPITLLIIDGNHNYNYCRADMVRFIPLVDPGGYIFIHDYHYDDPRYCQPGVDQAVDQWIAEHPDWCFYTAGNYAIFRRPS